MFTCDFPKVKSKITKGFCIEWLYFFIFFIVCLTTYIYTTFLTYAFFFIFSGIVKKIQLKTECEEKTIQIFSREFTEDNVHFIQSTFRLDSYLSIAVFFQESILPSVSTKVYVDFSFFKDRK